MSIDVEDWFHVQNLRRVVPKEAWDAQQLRVEPTMDRMLELMAHANVRATCFVLGWVAERLPGLVRRIADAGHEIASHGYGHDLVYDLRPAEFRDDVERSKGLLEDLSGRRVVGYRAPNFSITDWAFPILREVGFEYDSSFFPTTISHPRYGKPSSLRLDGSIVEHEGLTEVSLSCLPMGARALPWAGGGYLRLLPYAVFRRGVERILRRGPYVFYIHPWELDVDQPRVSGLKPSERLRHYLNLERTEVRWCSLLRDFDWMPIAEVLAARENEGIGSARTSTAGVPGRRVAGI
jgi:polysaccharide deacetylase family protein (PEP-CTERM system associated)